MHEAAAMGLMPWQFWRLTPRDFGIVRAGWRARQDDDMQRRAWEASIMVATFTGQKIHPLRLLGQEVPETPEPQTKAEFDAIMRERRRIADYGDV